MTLLNQKSHRLAFWGHTQTLIQINGIYLHLCSGSVQFTFSILLAFFVINCLSLYIYPVYVPMIILMLGVAPSCTKSFCVVVQRSHTIPTPCVLGHTAQHIHLHIPSPSLTLRQTAAESLPTHLTAKNCGCCLLYKHIFDNICFISFIMNSI